MSDGDIPIVLAGSVGGHLELLEALSVALGDRPRQWVTTEGARAHGLCDAGERVHVLPALDQSDFSVRRLLKSARLAARLRPKVIICSGAGVMAPFCLVGRALGAKILWVETMARVGHPSAAGRIVSRFSSRVLVQWPELAVHYPMATVCLPILLTSALPDSDRDEAARGTFVSVGSHREPFGRLLAVVRRAVADGTLPGPVLAQVGPGSIDADGIEERPTLTPQEFAAAVKSHRVTVCHGGAGVISTVLRSGRMPAVMARSKTRNEHVDDHQDELVDKLARLGLIVVIRDQISSEEVQQVLSADVSLDTVFGDLPTIRDEVSRWLASH
jgi:UDP-N-acetylglucosamine--N-acetylmuramyl-(pentapeptide) pyrophosphoryl-undecaprenol N-acetylglucosamine transferase